MVDPVDLGAPSDLIGAHEPRSIEAVLAAPNGYARAPREGWPPSVTAGRSPARLAQGRPGAIGAGDGTRGVVRRPAEGYCEGTPSTSGWARR